MSARVWNFSIGRTEGCSGDCAVCGGEGEDEGGGGVVVKVRAFGGFWRGVDGERA